MAPAAALADEPEQSTPSPAAERFHMGFNALAPLTMPDTIMTKMMVPMLTGLEYGLAINGGYHFGPAHSVELRLSTGSPHTLDFTSGHRTCTTGTSVSTSSTCSPSWWPGGDGERGACSSTCA